MSFLNFGRQLSAGSIWRTGAWLRAATPYVYFGELSSIFWERREEGFVGSLKFPYRALKYFACAVLAPLVFGRLMYASFLVIAWFHRVDDVVDGDMPVPDGMTIEEYREQKTALLSALRAGENPAIVLVEDLMLLGAMELCSRIGVSFLEECNDVWEVMEWECERRENLRLVSRTELVRETAKMDRAVLRVGVKVFRGNISHYDSIAKDFDGIFTRSEWLDDMLEDLQDGIVNIPIEALIRHRVDIAVVQVCKDWDELMNYKPFFMWFIEEIGSSFVEWRKLRAVLRGDFAGVCSSRFTGKLLERMAVGLATKQFGRAASRVEDYYCTT